jgi:hypothetical protein
MSEHTTASYLAAFRDELTELGFDANEVWVLVEFAAKQIISLEGLGVRDTQAVSA